MSRQDPSSPLPNGPRPSSDEPSSATDSVADDVRHLLEGAPELLAPELLRRYEPLAVVGRNALGAVLRVRHGVTGRFALLRVAAPGSVDPGTIEQQVEEARELTSFGHPNVAPVLDLGLASSGPWVVHGLADADGGDPGAMLGRWLSAASSHVLPIEIALEIGRQLFAAAGALHRYGRGWTLAPAPSDIGIRRVGATATATFLDLGLVRRWQQRAGAGTTGFVVGRLKHTAPELFEAQHAGGDARDSPASDLYSLGLVLYEMLTGHFPIPGESAASLIAGHLFQPPLSFAVSDPEERLPENLRDLLRRLLAKHPSARPESAARVAEELAEIRRATRRETADRESTPLSLPPLPVEALSSGSPTAGQLTGEGLPAQAPEELPAAESPAEEPPAGEPTAEEPPAGEPPAGEPTAEEPLARDPQAAGTLPSVAPDPVSTTRQLSMDELRQAVEAPKPEAVSEELISDLFLLEEPSDGPSSTPELPSSRDSSPSERPFSADGSSPVLDESSPSEMPTRIRPLSPDELPPPPPLPPLPVPLSGAGDIREITSRGVPETATGAATEAGTGAGEVQGAEIGSVTMPMDVVVEAKRRAAERRDVAGSPKEESAPAGGAPPPTDTGSPVEPVPSVTIPMSTVVEAKRRHEERRQEERSHGPRGHGPRGHGPRSHGERGDPPAAPSPSERLPFVEPATPRSPQPEPASSTAPPAPGPAPDSGAASGADPGAAPALAPGGPHWDGSPADSPTLSDLGFGGSDDTPVAVEPPARHRRRPRRARGSGQGSGRAKRWLGLLALIAILAVVFTISYQLSGRRLGTSFFGPTGLFGSATRPEVGVPADGSTASDPVSTPAESGAAPGAAAPGATTTPGAAPGAASAPAPAPTSDPGPVGGAGAASPGGPSPAASADLPPGFVRLDAAPWAIIESVRDSNGQAVPFSGARATPKLLALPPGRYEIVLASGADREGTKETLNVEVRSRQTVELRASFAPTVEEFLDAAGW